MKKFTRRNMLEVSGLSLAGAMTANLPSAASPEKDIVRSGKKKTLVFGAHPGDPACGCGGTMALLASGGWKVTSVYLTRGGGGIPGKTDEEAGRIRTEEGLKACGILGVGSNFFEQRDGATELAKDRYEEVLNYIRAENPGMVFTHWPVDSHRDHRNCADLVYDAWIKLDKKFALLYYEVTSGQETQHFYPTDYINIGPVIRQKTDACMAHASQNPESWYTNLQRTIEKYRGIELNCEFAEAFVRHNQSPETMVGE